MSKRLTLSLIQNRIDSSDRLRNEAAEVKKYSEAHGHDMISVGLLIAKRVVEDDEDYEFKDASLRNLIIMNIEDRDGTGEILKESRENNGRIPANLSIREFTDQQLLSAHTWIITHPPGWWL